VRRAYNTAVLPRARGPCRRPALAPPSRVALLLLAVAGLSGAAGPARALDTPNERVTLAGLTGVHVVVEEPGEAAERAGLRRASLEAEVTRRLRLAGLRVLGPAEAATAAGRPTLHLRVVVEPLPDAGDLHLYSVDLALRQQVRLVRDRAVESYAVTWSDTRVVGVARDGRLDVVRRALLEKVDQFLAAWRTVNQERY